MCAYKCFTSQLSLKEQSYAVIIIFKRDTPVGNWATREEKCVSS